MNREDRFLRGLNYFVLGWILGVVILCLASCASTWQAVKSAAAPAGGAAGGAAVGSIVGPGGAIVGAGIGAVIGNGLEENASLRSGETIGEGALKKEQLRWNGRTPQEWQEQANLAQQATELLYAIIKWGIAAFLLWFFWRSRHNFRDLGFWNGLKHSLGGGGIGKAIRR